MTTARLLLPTRFKLVPAIWKLETSPVHIVTRSVGGSKVFSEASDSHRMDQHLDFVFQQQADLLSLEFIFVGSLFSRKLISRL